MEERKLVDENISTMYSELCDYFMISEKEETNKTKLVLKHRTDSNEFFLIFKNMIDDIDQQIKILQKDPKLKALSVVQQTKQGIVDMMIGKESEREGSSFIKVY